MCMLVSYVITYPLCTIHHAHCVSAFGNCVTGTETVSQLARSRFPVDQAHVCFAQVQPTRHYMFAILTSSYSFSTNLSCINAHVGFIMSVTIKYSVNVLTMTI